MTRFHIAAVDDEPDLREALCEYLAANGFRATPLPDGRSLRDLVARDPVDLAVLDIAMPGEDGLSIARWLRANTRAGIIFATAAGQPIDRIVGLEIGADDYLVKPFELRELLARVRSVLRRIHDRPSAAERPATPAAAPARKRLRIGDLTLDLATRRLAAADGTPIDITAMEFSLLELLAASAGRVVSRQRIIDNAPAGEPQSARAVDIRVVRLRRKIEPDPDNPRYLTTVRGEGYLLNVSPS